MQHMQMGTTSMRVDEERLDDLHELKRRGESYDDVVERLIDHYEDTHRSPTEDIEKENASA